MFFQYLPASCYSFFLFSTYKRSHQTYNPNSKTQCFGFASKLAIKRYAPGTPAGNWRKNATEE